jgi:hypothetical protein
METTGKLTNVTRDILSGKLNITFQIDTTPIDEINDLAKIEDLDITAKKHRKKRSLDANALLWHCIGQMSSVLLADKWQVYLLMLKRYGKYTYIVAKENAVDAVKLQWRESEVVGDIDINGQKAVQMLCYFGSSTYDTKEFSHLLEGVISEMTEMGITPPTSEEMRRSLELWERKEVQHG